MARLYDISLGVYDALLGPKTRINQGSRALIRRNQLLPIQDPTRIINQNVSVLI